jgi:hypothetical protein
MCPASGNTKVHCHSAPDPLVCVVCLLLISGLIYEECGQTSAACEATQRFSGLKKLPHTNTASHVGAEYDESKPPSGWSSATARLQITDKRLFAQRDFSCESHLDGRYVWVASRRFLVDIIPLKVRDYKRSITLSLCMTFCFVCCVRNVYRYWVPGGRCWVSLGFVKTLFSKNLRNLRRKWMGK